jgi:hypothetical protein
MGKDKNIPFDKLFLNVKEACLTRGSAALENAYVNELGEISRFPGLASFVTLSGTANVYLHEWQGDLIAVCGSRTWRVSKSGVATEATGVQVSGNGRVMFDSTPNELLMAAGGPIVRLAAEKTEILSDDAPLSTHVGYIGGFAMAIELNTGLFFHSAANDFRSWDAIDVFAADARPDRLNSLLITPYSEIMLAGDDSIEQWEKLPAVGDPQFQRRWAIGEGAYTPYVLTFADNSLWSLNKNREFVRASGQVSRPNSDDIGGRVLEPVDNFDGAWASSILIAGQKFIILQLPEATNVYGTKGITLLYDYRQSKWVSLFGWDADLSLPNCWPGRSVYTLWGRHFVGGNGRIYELKTDVYQNGSDLQRVLWRSGNAGFGSVRIDNLRLRLKRGLTNSNDARKQISVRVLINGRYWTKWIRRQLGRYGETDAWIEFGQIGCADTFQIEVNMTDAEEFELIEMKVELTPIK